MIMRCYIWFNP